MAVSSVNNRRLSRSCPTLQHVVAQLQSERTGLPAANGPESHPSIHRTRVLAQDRLSECGDGSLLLEFKKAWKDGTRALVLQPHDLLVRLCAAVPPPRVHQLRYFGVLSSHSTLRERVVPQRTNSGEDTSQKPPAAPGDQLELLLGSDKSAEPSRRKRWSWMLAHVFRAVTSLNRPDSPER